MCSKKGVRSFLSNIWTVQTDEFLFNCQGIGTPICRFSQILASEDVYCHFYKARSSRNIFFSFLEEKSVEYSSGNGRRPESLKLKSGNKFTVSGLQARVLSAPYRGT